MGKISLGVNMEFVRHEDKPFEWGVEKAAELGYEYVEPMVHWGRELLSEAGYFHSVSMLDDPYRIRRACEKAGIKLSGLSAHTPLCKPEIGTEYLKQAVRFAAECGAPVVNTDEGPKPAWTTEEEDHVLMRYTLKEAAAVAEPRGILIGIEPHQQYSKTPAGLDRICGLVDSPAIGINFDTGNSYLAGRRPDRVAPARQGPRWSTCTPRTSRSAIRRRARQGDRHAGRLRLRRRRDRLGQGDRGLQDGPARHRLQRRVRHGRAGRPQHQASARAVEMSRALGIREAQLGDGHCAMCDDITIDTCARSRTMRTSQLHRTNRELRMLD